MRYFLDSKPVSFEQFQIKFPEESKILAPWVEKQLDANIEIWAHGNQLSFSSGSVSKIGINYSATLEKHRRTFFKKSPYQENLARALGVKRDEDRDLRILDATAGLMSDSLMMIALGLRELTLCERHPPLQALILNTLRQTPDFDGISFIPVDAAKIVENFDVIFFDPMYQEVNKRAASKKQMVFMREVVGPDEDAVKVAQHLRSKCHRLVIKRSQKAQPLIPKPDHQVKGKSTDFDIYFNNTA